VHRFETLFRVEPVKVTDGDTLVLNIYLGLGIWLNAQKVRLLGINAPELKGEERPMGLKVRDYLASVIQKSEGLIARSDEEKKGKYGRFLMVLYAKLDGKWVNVNSMLVEKGAAREYMASDSSDAAEVFDPPPEDIEQRVVVDEERTERDVYENGEPDMDKVAIASELVKIAGVIMDPPRKSFIEVSNSNNREMFLDLSYTEKDWPDTLDVDGKMAKAGQKKMQDFIKAYKRAGGNMLKVRKGSTTFILSLSRGPHWSESLYIWWSAKPPTDEMIKDTNKALEKAARKTGLILKGRLR
jgi:micrococcal nuclease